MLIDAGQTLWRAKRLEVISYNSYERKPVFRKESYEHDDRSEFQMEGPATVNERRVNLQYLQICLQLSTQFYLPTSMLQTPLKYFVYTNGIKDWLRNIVRNEF